MFHSLSFKGSDVMAKTTEKVSGVKDFLQATAKHEAAVKAARSHKASFDEGFLPPNVRGIGQLTTIRFKRSEKGIPTATINFVCVEPEEYAGQRASKTHWLQQNDYGTLQEAWEGFYDDLQKLGADPDELEKLSREQLVSKFCPEFCKGEHLVNFVTVEGKDIRYPKVYFNSPAEGTEGEGEGESEEEASEGEEGEPEEEASEGEEEETPEEEEGEEEGESEEEEPEEEKQPKKKEVKKPTFKIGQTVRLHKKNGKPLARITKLDLPKKSCTVKTVKDQKVFTLPLSDIQA